ncbi:hypothetical_protein (plasmid) [Leishmania braziliensis MHOM/BR/75/M2904]|nr:hypothetical_protein [Leishmania braziliensis MHOM/BR/75/M2904]
MHLRWVCVTAVAMTSASLPHRSVADGLLALPRGPAARGLRQGRRAKERLSDLNPGTAPLRTSLRGERCSTWTLGRHVLQTDGAGDIEARSWMRSWGGIADAAASMSPLASAALCTRSPLACLRASCAALATPCRCCVSSTGVARAPPSPSHDFLRLRGSHSKRPPSDSLPPSASQYKKRVQQHKRRGQAPVHGNTRSCRGQKSETLRLQTPHDCSRDDASPSKPEVASVNDHEDGASVDGDGTGASSAHGAAAPSARGHGATAGWGLEDVNSRTGRTQLEELYERNLDRIRVILEQPLPVMPQDGSIDPDLFVGFAFYSYQLRDQYRAVLARELQVPVKAVRLSVAWSGRFDVRRFGRVQKVCGVCLDRQALLAATHGETEKSPGSGLRRKEGDLAAQTPIVEVDDAASPLSETLQHRIHALVATINGRKREDLLRVSFFQASLPIPEVEFALTRREHRLLHRLHEWIRRHVLQRAVVVVVYGVPPPPPPTTATGTRSASATAGSWSDSSERKGGTCDTAGATRGDAPQRDRYALWQRLCSARTTAQKREVQEKWLRLFHRRKLVPSMISLTELATEVAVAVVRGEVLPIDFGHATREMAGAKQTSGEAEKGGGEHRASPDTPLMGVAPTPAVLSASLQDVVVRIAAASSSSAPPPTPGDYGALAEDSDGCTVVCRHTQDVIAPPRDADTATAAADVGPRFRPASTAQEEATMRWVQLVYQALFLREAQGSTDGSSYTDAEQPAMRVSHQVSLPALFAQGAYAGGQEEVAYLQRNRVAMDALLLHPHEISFKKKFVSRMRNGHRRLRMEEESAPPYSASG